MANLEELLVTYDKDQAHDIGVKLEEYNIVHNIEYPESNLETTYGIQNHTPIKVMVAMNQKDEAQEILGMSVVENDIDMSDYNEDDLLEVILHEDEWHSSTVDAAKKELTKRGLSYEKAAIEAYQQERIEKLKKGNPAKKIVMIWLWISAFTGALGFLFGIFMTFDKVKGFDGKKYYYYNESVRKQGAIITFIGLIITVFSLVILWS